MSDACDQVVHLDECGYIMDKVEEDQADSCHGYPDGSVQHHLAGRRPLQEQQGDHGVYESGEEDPLRMLHGPAADEVRLRSPANPPLEQCQLR